MRRWLVSSVILIAPTSVWAVPTRQATLPLASHFDLSGSLLHPASLSSSSNAHMTGRQWLLPEMGGPPSPHHDPPMLRIRGKKVKLRIPFG